MHMRFISPLLVFGMATASAQAQSSEQLPVPTEPRPIDETSTEPDAHEPVAHESTPIVDTTSPSESRTDVTPNEQELFTPATTKPVAKTSLDAPTKGAEKIREEPAVAKQKAKKSDSALAKPSPRQGHYISLGFHGTSAIANDRDRGRRGPAFGTGYSLRLGERIMDRLDLGLAFAYASVGGDDPWSFGRLTVHAQGYITEKTFAHLGFGFGAAGGADPEDPDFSRGRFGDVYTAGAGHNFYLSDAGRSGGWIVSPTITMEYGRDDTFPNAGLWVGVEISRWWGIPRNQLDLDFDEAYKR